MGAFLSLMSGLAKGAGTRYSEISDEERKNKMQQNSLAADAIQKELENNPNLDRRSHEMLSRQLYTFRGVPKKIQDTLIQAHGHFWDLNEAANQAKGKTPGTAPSPTSVAAGSAPDPKGGNGDFGGETGASATSSATPSAPGTTSQGQGQMAPPMPSPPPELDHPFGPPPTPTGAVTTDNARMTEWQKSVNDYRAKTGEAQFATKQKSEIVQNRIKSLKDEKIWDQLTPRQRAEVMSGETNITPEFRQGVRMAPGSSSGSSVKDMFPVDKLGNPTDEGKDYKVEFDGAGTPSGVIPTQLSARPEDWVKLENGQFGHVIRNAAGKLVSVQPAIPPAYLLPQINTQQSFRSVTQPDGSTQLVPVQTSTTKTSDTSKIAPTQGPSPGQSITPASPLPQAPGAPGAPQAQSVAPPGRSATPKSPLPSRGGAKITGPGIEVGGRPMPPEQKVKNSQQAEQLNNTVGTIKDLMRDTPVLGSLISTGKIAMQIDPHQGFWKAIVNKNSSMTDDEKRVAANWQNLTEAILQMRIPMGGAGFRGPEGFGAIESNKGMLGQDPTIIKTVLSKALKEFKAQRDPLAQAGKKYGYDVKDEKDTSTDDSTPGRVYAKNPKTGHRIVSTDKVNWFDAETGVRVK